MENFNIDNFNLPMPVSEKELDEFESFVDDFSRRMENIIHGNLEDPELDQALSLPSILKNTEPAVARTGAEDEGQSTRKAPAAKTAQFQNGGQVKARQEQPKLKTKTKPSKTRGPIDYSRFESIASDEDDDGKSSPTPAPSSAIDKPETSMHHGQSTAAPATFASSKMQSATQLLDKAKSAVSRGEWATARDLYCQVVDQSSSHGSLHDDTFRAHANLTLVYLKLNQHDLVVTHANILLSKDPLHVKVLWRKCTALLALRDTRAWICAQVDLRKAVTVRPGDLDLVRVVKDEDSGWRKLGLIDNLGGDCDRFKLELAARALHALGKDAISPILMWMVDHGFANAVAPDHGNATTQLSTLQCAMVDLVRLVADDPVTRPVLSKLAPKAAAQWLQMLWTHFGSDPTVSTFLTTHTFSSLDFVLPLIDPLCWYHAGATHIRQSSAHSISFIVQTIHKSSLHFHPVDHAPWSLIDALVSCANVARDHVVAISVNLLTTRPTTDPLSTGQNRIDLPRLLQFLKQHGTVRLWSRLTRVPSLAPDVAQLIAGVSSDLVLQSTDTLRAWTVAALDAELVDPTRILATVFKSDKVDTRDHVIVGNTALLIARAVQQGQWRDKDMEVATRVLLPLLQERAALARKSDGKQDKTVRQNLAIALARLCSASPKAREWMRQKRGMELLATVTSDQ